MAKKRKPSTVEDYFGELLPLEPIPDIVEVPEIRTITADDLSWSMSTASGRRDLKELLDHVFDQSTRAGSKQWLKAYDMLLAVLSERYGRTVRSLWTFLEFVKLKKYPPLEWQAACWNEMLHRLEFKVKNSERADPGLGEEP